MSDISAMVMTPESLLTRAASHLSVARDVTGKEFRHHADIADVYTACASTLTNNPDTALDINEVVSLLRDAQRQGPYDSREENADLVQLAWLRLRMARVARNLRERKA
jgi:hypothetical protein